MPICPLTVPAHALPAVGFMLGHSTFHIKRRRHLRRNTSPFRLIYSFTQHNQQCSVISQSSWELTRSERKDTSNDNPMESGLSEVASTGTCTLPLHCVTSRLLAPKGLLLRLSLLKIKAKVYAHVLLDTDLWKWKDILLSVERFRYSQSGTTVPCNMLGLGTLLVEGNPSWRTADPRIHYFNSQNKVLFL